MAMAGTCAHACINWRRWQWSNAVASRPERLRSVRHHFQPVRHGDGRVAFPFINAFWEKNVQGGVPLQTQPSRPFSRWRLWGVSVSAPSLHSQHVPCMYGIYRQLPSFWRTSVMHGTPWVASLDSGAIIHGRHWKGPQSHGWAAHC